MFLARRPSPRIIERFVRDSQALPLSYSPIGIVDRGEAAGCDGDDATVAIGRGRRDFERARAALMAWRHFDIGWVDLFPRRPAIAAGTVVVILVHHLGFWSLNGCRVVYTVGSLDEARFGFAYGTLTNHAAAGEELFEVLMDSASDDVLYRIRAIARPRAALARIGRPIVRTLQARFRRDSAAALARATRGQ